MRQITKDTTLCISLAGSPSNVGTRFHNYLYGELDLDYIYKAFTTTDLRGAIGGLRALGIRGCGVSMPFKEACLPYLDALADSAAAIQAVNTVVNSNGTLRGFNTDYTAIRALLTERAREATDFAVIGSGGVAKAVVAALHDCGYRTGVIVARNREAGLSLAKKFGFSWQPELRGEHPRLIINATPLGMAGGAAPEQLPFSRGTVEAAQVVFDVVASPPLTPLLLLAKELGKTSISGSDLMSLQALEQFELYTGERPTDEQVRRASEFARSGP